MNFIFYNFLRIVTSNSEYFKSPWKIPVKCITTPSTDITDFLCCDAQNPSKHVIQTVVNSQEQAYTYIVMWKMYLVKSWIMIMNFRFRYTLFRKKRFEINFFVRRNASKFAIFIEKKTHIVFFIFHFEHFWVFPYECPGLCWHRPGHS